MSDSIVQFKELITKSNYSFYTTYSGDMSGSFSSTGIFQLDENTAFVSIVRRENHLSKEEKVQYKVTIDLYNEIFDLIKKNKLTDLEKAPKEEFIAYDMGTSKYHIRIGDKGYSFSSSQKIDTKRREVIWNILDLIHGKER